MHFLQRKRCPNRTRLRNKACVNELPQWHLLWLDALRPLARLKADGSLEAIYFYADQANVPAAMQKDGVLYQIVTDQLGSVRLVLHADTAEVAQAIRYDAWGRITHDSNPGFQPFAYAGGLYDPDTGLTRFGARDYDAETGRWTAKDPIGFAGGDSSLYAYVGGNPVGATDPEGLESLITGFTTHGLHQAINRGVSPGAMCDAVNNSIKVQIMPNGTTRYTGGGAVVVLNPAGRIVTTWRK